MKMFQTSSLLSLALVSLSFAPLRAGEPDWLTVVGLYPQPGSVTGQSEQAILLWLQKARTNQDVVRAVSENHLTFGCYAADIHLPAASSDPSVSAGARPIDLRDFPRTEAVLEQARADMAPALDSLQATFSRPRPYVLNAALTPALPAPASFSYPSTHAAVGALYAEILRQWDPADQDAFRATGTLIGTDRVLGGVHYPSDAEAGQRFGRAFATYWIDQPEHLKLIQTACEEWK